MPSREDQRRSDEKTRVSWLTTTLQSASGGSFATASGVEVVAGAGAADDCAVLRISAPLDLVVGTDYVRGPKFRLHELGYLSDADVARFCVTANVSDLAAMGATPVGYLSIVRYPSSFSDDDFFAVMKAIDDACLAYECALLGGDTGSAERLILTGTAIGSVATGRSLRRSAAKPGDAVVVTGAVGGAGAAVLAADASVVEVLPEAAWSALLESWTSYTAQPAAGQLLARAESRIACQDVSDGLLATLREIAEPSDVSMVLDERLIPRAPGVDDVAAALGIDAVSLAMSASTDFCLCFTCPSADLSGIISGLEEVGVVATRIGTVQDGSGIWLDDDGGQRCAPRAVEWKHQEGAIADVIVDGLRRDGAS